MNVLVLGSGGREHALAWAIAKSPRLDSLFVAPGNGGTATIAKNVPLDMNDADAVIGFARSENIDLVVIGPEAPLVAGVADAIRAAGIAVFGPGAQGARLEGSKSFSKEFMLAHGLPTARYKKCTSQDEAMDYLHEVGAPIVVKADGLALGKGVLICNTREEARDAVRSMMIDNRFGMSGSRVVIEEFLTGPEVSVLAFTDGKCIKPMVSSMDHKRALDHDEGLNTGGMGTIAPNPYYTADVAKRCMEEIFLPTVHAMNAEGRTFRGCLYFGLMLTPKGPKVIEYNCRFGDPETQVVLPLLESDLLTVMQATTNGTLKDTPVRFKTGSACCCVVMASQGYPQSYETGFPLTMDADAAAHTFVAGAKLREDGVLVTSGGRVAGVTAVQPTLGQAVQAAYERVGHVHFENAYYRRDIGARALQALREEK